MTVTAKLHVSQRPWRGYLDPGLPVGMYIASGTVLGDGSGGNEVIQFIFRGEGNSVTGRFYNIEQLEVMRASTVAQNGFLESFNFESVGATGLVNYERHLRVEVDEDNFGTALDQSTGPKMPLFLGSAQALADLEAQVNVGFKNGLNITLAASIQGYIWEARSVMAEGGLRRPADSLYGR